MLGTRPKLPQPPLRRGSREPGSLPKAIAVGVAIDLLGTAAATLFIGAIYSVVLAQRGHSQAQIEQIFGNFDPLSALGLLVSAIGLSISAYAGYKCAQIANRNDYLGPGILAVISCSAGALMSTQAYTQVMLGVFSALNVIAVLSGAWLHVRRLA